MAHLLINGKPLEVPSGYTGYTADPIRDQQRCDDLWKSVLVCKTKVSEIQLSLENKARARLHRKRNKVSKERLIFLWVCGKYMPPP